MSQARTLSAVPEGGLPLYPVATDERLTSHYFVALHFDRYLNSSFRANSTAIVRLYGMELWLLAQKQSPVGTLPESDRDLAFLLHLDLAEWQDLRRLEWGPLYKWTHCITDQGEVRLMHPVVLEVVQDSIGRRDAHRMSQSERAQAARIKRMKDTLTKHQAHQIARSPVAMEWMAEWLSEHPIKNWTEAWVMKAANAWSIRDLEDQ